MTDPACCPRCSARLLRDNDGPYCLLCGWHGYRPLLPLAYTGPRGRVQQRRLTDAQEREIRRRARTTLQRVLAEEYGVSVLLVNRIVRGERGARRV